LVIDDDDDDDAEIGESEKGSGVVLNLRLELG
jgi:hypothetical protein